MAVSLWMTEEPCVTCGVIKHETESFNYTYNCSTLWYQVYPQAKAMVDIDGLTGEDSIRILDHAIATLESNPDYYRQFNPKNAWGSYEGFVVFLMKLSSLAQNNLTLKWVSCR